MIQVRPVGGSYRHAMAQVARIEATPAAIRAHFGELLDGAGISGEVAAKRAGYDSRNGWGTFTVLVGGVPCCYADGPLQAP
ncbi:hypothetical protein [Delftia sp. UGAL515B_04]|uniref:hypothetical protein n=1 Tax=Delftia sp. UGAL515B_04 TaxID=2986766 RepID=UPI0029549B4E|nr:hypothetical protein [Delftia sp. UGAL515B_04]WON88982.1 hypothetical protein OK021_30405 [Delftia sp. UGAL515B_04]